LKTMNSFKDMQGLYLPQKIQSSCTINELVFQLIKYKKIEEMEIASCWIEYLEKLNRQHTSDSIKYNKLIISTLTLINKNFDLKDKFQKDFCAFCSTVIGQADKMHKELRGRDLNLYLVSPSAMEYIRCFIYMHMGNYVYFDENIFVGFRPCLGNKSDELFVFVKNNDHYSFDSFSATKSKLKISSVKKAKKAIASWKGEMKVGFSLTLASSKLCKLLGLNVNETNGEVRLCRRKGVGF